MIKKRKLILVLVACICLLSIAGCQSPQKINVTPEPSVTILESTPTDAPTTSLAPTNAPAFTSEPTNAPTKAQSPSPSITPKPVSNQNTGTGKLAGKIIGIDSGHQIKANLGVEPIAPGSSITKMKCSAGTAGINSRVPEYVVNLNVSLKLRDMLEAEGATVIMTHTDNNVNITNIERAQIFNTAKTDFSIRIHCNGMDDTSLNGAFVMQPASNPYLSDCQKGAKCVLDEYIKETGFYSKGVYTFDNQTGFNWCDRMIICIEMGHLSNPSDDARLTNADVQTKMATGIFNGIMKYYS